MYLIKSFCIEYFASGSNYRGKLGIKSSEYQINTFQADNNFQKEFKSIQQGENHVLAITVDGKLFAWGDNTYQQLGFSSPSQQNSPLQIEYFKNIKVVQADGGLQHSVILTENNQVYTCGSNRYGQLVRDGSNSPQLVSPKFFKNETVIQVAAQDQITYIMTDKSVYVFGNCKNGQCATHHNNKMDLQEIPTKIWAGEESVFIQTAKGLFAAGANTHGQLCFPPNLNDYGNYQEQLVKLVLNPIHVSGGHYHTLFLLEGKVMGCGLNSAFQMSSNGGEFHEPTLISDDENIRAVAACSDGSIFLKAEEILVIGSQLTGELGIGNKTNVEQMYKIDLKAQDVDQLSCRSDFAIIHSIDHKIPQSPVNIGLIVGVSVGGAILLVIICVLMYVVGRLWKDKKKYKHIKNVGRVSNDQS